MEVTETTMRVDRILLETSADALSRLLLASPKVFPGQYPLEVDSRAQRDGTMRITIYVTMPVFSETSGNQPEVIRYELLELTVIDLNLEPDCLIVHLRQSYCTDSLYDRVLRLLRGKFREIPDPNEPVVIQASAPAISVRVKSEPSEESVRHDLGYEYMLEHDCSWQVAFRHAWLPDYERQNGKQLKNEQQDLSETFRVAVSRRKKPKKT